MKGIFNPPLVTTVVVPPLSKECVHKQPAFILLDHRSLMKKPLGLLRSTFFARRRSMHLAANVQLQRRYNQVTPPPSLQTLYKGFHLLYI